MHEHEDVVITGCGAITPLGNDPQALYQSLLAGRSAVQTMPPNQGVDGDYWLGAAIESFDPKQFVQPRKSIKVMCREIQIAYASAMQACAQSGIAAGSIDPDRIGTVFGSEIFFSEILDVESIVTMCSEDGRMKHDEWGVKAMDSMYPLWMLKSLPNMAACHVGIALDARGPNNTITTETTSGIAALLEAINVIRRGLADVMIVASTASRLTPSRLLQRFETDFSRAFSNPAVACKPYDQDRDGTTSAEGSAAIVIETRSSAIRRNAPILGTIVSWANVFSPPKSGRWTGVRGGASNALQLLMDRAGLTADQIDHINGGANGTVAADSGEAHAVHDHASSVPVVSYRGGLGDAVSAAGMIDLVASLVGMQSNAIAPTTNHTRTADDCPVTVISGSAKPRTKDHWIKLSHTALGHTVGVTIQS